MVTGKELLFQKLLDIHITKNDLQKWLDVHIAKNDLQKLLDIHITKNDLETINQPCLRLTNVKKYFGFTIDQFQ